jgi:hypothetical protein
MTALLPRDLVVDIVASVRRLGGLGDCLTTTEQFFLAEELRTSADCIDRGARPPPSGRLVLISPDGFCGRPLYQLVRS